VGWRSGLGGLFSTWKEGASACHEKDPEKDSKEGRQEKKWRQGGWNPHPSFMIPTG
jgi:hypothetical protein